MTLSRRKGRAFILMIFIIINTYLAGILKAGDCDPRPFWTNSEIKNIGFYCPVEYGNPSGHSWFSTVLGFGFILDFYGVGKNYKNLIVALGLIIFVPMSRMYLGAHSLNQILEGLLLGSTLNILYLFYLKEKIQMFLVSFNTNRKWKYMIFGLHFLCLLPYFMNMGDGLPKKWIKNIN